MLKLPYILLGFLSLVLAVFGAFLPVLPTTPFVLLSGYGFSKGSPKLHSWLRSLPAFGPLLIDYENYRVISRKAKWLATVMMIALVGYQISFGALPSFVKGVMAIVIAGVISFIWSHPEEVPLGDTLGTDSSSC